jgi:hypothetical protein
MITLKAYQKDSEGLSSSLISTLYLRGVKSLNVERQAKASTRRSEVGYEYTDNMSLQSNKVAISGYVSDINKDDNGNWTAEESYIDGIENSLISIYENKYFCDVYDGKRGKVYSNYIILDLSISEKSESTKGFEFSMNLQEVRFSTIGITKYIVNTEKGGPYSSGNNKSGSTKDGKTMDGKTSIAGTAVGGSEGFLGKFIVGSSD